MNEKTNLQSDLFRAHEACREEDAQRRRFNRIYGQWLDTRFNPENSTDNPYHFDEPDSN